MRRLAFYLVLTTTMMAAKTVFADAEVYLAVRTDGKDGAGTATDPFNASTQAKFDALFAHFGPNTAIHLGPGTYHTKGAASFSVKPYWKIRGAGYEVTRIIQDRVGVISCTVFRGTADGVEIEDLSIDCGFENQQVVNGKIKANVSAIGLGGSHIAVRRCLVKNYGSPYDADTGENFAVFISSPDPANGENLVVEDCIFTGMSPLLTSGQSVLTIAGGPPKNDLKAGNWARGVIARRNHFTGYHYGCHGITVDGAQGAMIVNNVFEHFMGGCIYQDTWPMRDLIIADNIFSDVNQAIRLACNDMSNFQIKGNIILLNDGYDLKDIVGSVARTAIDHSLAVGNMIRIRGAKLAGGAIMPDKDVYVTSMPTRSSFTYSRTRNGKNETGDNAVGGFVQALDYEGCISPAPEAIAVFGRDVEGKYSPPTNFNIYRNIIKSYSSDDAARVPSSGISVYGMKNTQITDNVIFDSGNHADLIVNSPKGFTSTVICRDNYHPDGTPRVPRDGNLKIIPGGLLDLPLCAGRNITLTPINGKIRIDANVTGPATGRAVHDSQRMAHQVEPKGPAGNSHYPGKPGDYALQGKYLYIYTGDGSTHQWKRAPLLDY